MERHLDNCQYGEVEVYETVERLKELNLLNDEQYAEEFVRSRLASKPVSRSHLREQLRQHEVPEIILEKALDSVDESIELDNACQVVRIYMRQAGKLSEEERRQKVIQRVVSRGFSYGTARKALEQYLNKKEDPDA